MRIAKQDLRLSCFKRTQVQIITVTTKQKRIDRAKALIRRFSVQRSKCIFFTDEKAFYLDPSESSQNTRVWSASKKTAVTAERLLIQRAKFSQHVMVSAGVCFEGKGRLHFIPDKTKINAGYYSLDLLPLLLEDCQNLM